MEKEQMIRDGLIGLHLLYLGYCGQLYLDDELATIEFVGGYVLLVIGMVVAWHEGKKFQSDPI